MSATSIAVGSAAPKPAALSSVPPPQREKLNMYGWIAFGLILVVAWFLRARDFQFSTAYMDEALYINYGRMFLTHHYQWPMDHPLRWTWGWYLWPAMAATANSLGGLAAVRALAAFLGLVTVTAVFGFAKRLFSPPVALASAMIFAILGPAVFSSRIASRDCSSIPFFALGLWAYAAAWEDNKPRLWLAASGCFLAAFLCKYIVAIYFPVLVLLSLKKGLKPFLLFCAPLTLACAFYLGFYWQDLGYLREYGRQYHQLAINIPALIWENYVSKHYDFWILAGLALLAVPLIGRKNLWKSIFLLLGAGIFLFFQWRTRADRDYWKHATYPLLFLTPLAMAGVIAMVRRIRFVAFPVAASVVVMGLGVGLGWAGSSWRMEESLNWASRAVWPDAGPILTYLDGRLTPQSRVLADDNVFGYYLNPPMDLSHIADPFFFKYVGQVGDPAYLAAVHDGYFDFILFDTGVGEEAQHLRALLQPVLSERYTLRLHVTDKVLGHPLEVFERTVPPPVQPAPPTGPAIQIQSPRTDEVVQTQSQIEITLRGAVSGAKQGWYVRVDVYTNQWYPQGDKVYPNLETGVFSQVVHLGGNGPQQCHHMVRAQLFDEDGNLKASNAVFEVKRANPDGAPPACLSEP